MSEIEKPDRIGAFQRVETIREGMRGYAMAWDAMAEAFEARDWVTLGHPDWDTYCEKEFSERKLKLTGEARERAVLALRNAGMSTRAIGSALGLPKSTVADTLSQVSEPGHLPAETLGADGKTYPASRPTTDSQPAASDAGGDSPARSDGAPTGQPSEPDVPEGDSLVATPGQPGHEPSNPVGGDAPAPPTDPPSPTGESGDGGTPEEGVRAPSSGTPPPDPDALRGRPDLDPDAVERYAGATTAAEVSAWRRDFTKALNTARKALRPYTAAEIVERADEEGDGEFVDFRDLVIEMFDEWQRLKTEQRLAKVRPLRSVS